MKSEASSVDDYIAAADEDRQATLAAIRKVYRKVLKGAEEVIDYGMPCYKRGEVLLGAFASQKQYIALYGFGKVIEQHKAELKGANLGKGCIRYKSVAAIDMKLVETMLREKLAAQAK